MMEAASRCRLFEYARNPLSRTLLVASGMTGGQMAPTTPAGAKTLTSPGGSPYAPINIQGLVTSHPRHRFARASAFHIAHLRRVIAD